MHKANTLMRIGYWDFVKSRLEVKIDHISSKILEFDNSLVTNIILYEKAGVINKEGLLNKKIDRRTVNPIFSINLDKNETKTYYMEV